MEKKLTNSGPLMEPADKHSIYPLWGLHALVELCPLVLQSTPENWTAGRIWFQSCMGKEKATALAGCPSNEADAPTHAI